MTDLTAIFRERDQRRRRKESMGAGMHEVTMNVFLRGIANTAMGMTSTGRLKFGIGFYPRPSEFSDVATPAFRCGFTLGPDGTEYDPDDLYALMGFANCHKWIQNDDGLFVAAEVSIGVINLSAEGGEQPFKGHASLSFLGYASGSLDESGPDEESNYSPDSESTTVEN